jgi:hypothetical protein
MVAQGEKTRNYENMSKKSLKDDVKMTVNALLVPHVRGLTLDRLLKEYYDVENKQLPFRLITFACFLLIPPFISNFLFSV